MYGPITNRDNLLFRQADVNVAEGRETWRSTSAETAWSYLAVDASLQTYSSGKYLLNHDFLAVDLDAVVGIDRIVIHAPTGRHIGMPGE